VVTISSSNTEEALGLLSLSPCRNLSSQFLGGNVHEPSSSSGSNLFEDWSKANDMAASIYVALTAEALGSLVSTTHAPRVKWKSHATSSSTQQSHCQATSSQKSR
jgi:hypothetical protein